MPSKRTRDDFIESEEDEGGDEDAGYGADDVSEDAEEEMEDKETDEDTTLAKKKAKSRKAAPPPKAAKPASTSKPAPKKKAKTKRDPDEEEEDTKPDVEDDEEAVHAPRAKAKAASKSSKSSGKLAESGGVEVLKNEEGDSYIQLSKSRRITVRQYNKVTLVDIREYYTDKSTGTEKPGKKGISLPVDDWRLLASGVADIENLVEILEKK